MRAGLLRETLTFLAPVESVDRSGFVEKTYKPAFTCRACRKKLSSVVGDGVRAMEVFIETTIVFQVRFDPRIKADQRVEYGGSLFRIVPPLDRRLRDNTYLITCSKIDK